MNNKNKWLLFLAMVLTAGTILVDRFVVAIPTWLAMIFLVCAIVAFIVYFVTNRKVS